MNVLVIKFITLFFLVYRLFEERCINMLDRMYDEEPEHAVDVMDDEAMIWGVRSSPLIIAYENSMYDIVAHTCSQKHLNKQWYNNLAPDLKPFCKVKLILHTKITCKDNRYVKLCFKKSMLTIGFLNYFKHL